VCKIKIRELDELKRMGFGLWELKTLRNLIIELAAESGEEAEKGNAIKKFIDDIEIYRPDYLRLRSKVKQLKEDEGLFRSLLVAMGGLGPTISSYLGRKPTANDIRELIRVIEGYPKTTTIVNISSVGINEEPSQSAVQTNVPSSHQIDKQGDEIKTNGHERSETDSSPTNAKLFDFKMTQRKKSNIRLRPPHPPLLPKPKRLLRDSTRTNLSAEKAEFDTTNYFGKQTLSKNVSSYPDKKAYPVHPDFQSCSDSIFKHNNSHDHDLNNTHDHDLNNNSKAPPPKKYQNLS
jgi:hypothetical protein